jgi:hypothetical protein
MSTPRVNVKDGIKQEGRGWLYVLAAMAQSAKGLGDMAVARQCLRRAAALARVINMTETDSLRSNLLDPLANSLGILSIVNSVPEPPAELWGETVDGRTLERFVQQNGAAPIDWVADPFGPVVLSPPDGKSLDDEVARTIISIEKGMLAFSASSGSGAGAAGRSRP